MWVDATPADESWPRHVVGILDGACWYAVDVPAGADPSDGAAIDLRAYHGRAGEAAWLAAGRAVQLVEWARTHRFCGRCATPTEPAHNERAMRCPACGLQAFPRLAPAMITLVTRGDDGPTRRRCSPAACSGRSRCTPASPASSSPASRSRARSSARSRRRSAIVVGDVPYRGSQPWPFPHSLMIGFRARYVSGELELDPTEIVDAGWYRRDALPTIPPGISIARKLIDAWVADEAASSR